MINTSFSPSELYYTVYFLFGLTFVSCIIVWNSNIHKDPRFSAIVSLLTALTIFFTSFAIIIQLYTFHAQQTDSEIQIYDTMFTNLFHDSIDYFTNNPKMNYYYNEIFRPLNYKYTPTSKRYYTEEQQVTRLILQDLAALIYYLQNDKSISQTETKGVQIKINRFIIDLLRSPVFIENYKQMKPTLMSPLLRKYMETNFNI
jgi:hypothetical protein